MTKTYILQKDLPDGSKIGDRYIRGEYRYYNERIHAEAKGIIESVNWETWQVENNPEWFLPEENKSSDSFQWDDDLVKELLWSRFPFPEGVTNVQVILDDFKDRKEHERRLAYMGAPKPQAENKPKYQYVDSDLNLKESDTPITATINKPDWEVQLVKDRNGKIWPLEYWDTNGTPNCGFMGNSYGYWLATMNRKGHSIHSVKRLSDQITFSVDEITDGGNKIISFEVEGGDLKVQMKSASEPKDIGWATNIASLVKKKQSEPDWEIGAFKHKDGKSVGYLAYDKVYWSQKNWEQINIKQGREIESVKRLSDGEVFSVGDYVNDCKYPIAGFNICDDGKRMYVYGEKNSWGQDLPKINKSLPPQPQKLFTTEDGVDMFEGDECWEVCCTHDAVHYDYLDLDMWDGRTYYPDSYKYFHTKEAAEKYIAENKPRDYSKYDFTGAQKNIPPAPQPQKEESICKSPSGNCVNSNVCQELDHCMYLDREKSKPEKEEQRIEVDFQFMFPYGQHKGGGAYNLSSPIIIPEEKLSAIKQAIEQVLNGDKRTIGIKGEWGTSFISKEQYDKELDAMCEDAFNAAREDSYSKTTRMTPGAAIIDQALHLLKYKSYQDYKQSKQ